MPILLSTFYFFYFAIVGVYVIFMPKVLAMSGYSASEIGIIFAAGPMVRFILPFAFTRGLKLNTKSFNIALLIMLSSSVAFYLSLESFYRLLLSNIGLGLGMSLILPYIEVISLSQIGKERYGKIRLFGSVGFVLVALVLVKLLSEPSVALNFLISMAFMTALFGYVIVKNADKTQSTHEKVEQDINLLQNLLLILQITTFASAVRWFLIFAFPQNLIVLFFTQSLHALSFALFHSAAISYLFHLYKHKSLAQQFFSGITYGLGGFSGALLAGYIYELYPKYLFLSSTFLAFMAFVLIYLWERRVKSLNR